MIPRIIYVFWDGDMDVFTTACLENIKRMNPSCKVVLLSSDTIENKPTHYDTLSPQAKSDWARVESVSKTGGIWIDIHCIVLKPFESWVDFTSDAFHGFYIPFGCDVIENWAFAAPKNCPLVMEWKNEFKNAIEVGFETYNEKNEIPDCIRTWLPYLTIHQALHIARKKVPDKKLKILSSTDTHMPYHLISKYHWNNTRFIDMLLKANDLDSIFIKMNGGMRAPINNLKLQPTSLRDSHFERVLHISDAKSINIIYTTFLISVLLFLIVCFSP